MTDQQKLYRVFRLIQLLSQRPYRTASHLAQLLEVSDKTVYRYLDLLQAVGYVIEKEAGHRYYLRLEIEPRQDFLDKEEAAYLQELLWTSPAGAPYRDRLLHKLNRQYTLAPIAQSLTKFAVYEHIRALGAAIEANRQVMLRNYYAPSSDTLRHRHVEPVEFMQNYTYLWAYDLEAEDYRQYKLERIGQVEILDQRISRDHESRVLDLFGWTGPEWLPVKLRLSPYAHNLLLEEYPDARPFLHAHKGAAYFDGTVRDWRGIGRFVLGLPGEVEVVAPEGFRAYLRERVDSVLF